MTSGEIWAAIAGAAIVQLLNTWKLWMRFAVLDSRVQRMEEQLEQIGHFRINRDITGGARS